MASAFMLELDTTPPGLIEKSIPKEIRREKVYISLTFDEVLDQYQDIRLLCDNNVIYKPIFTISSNKAYGDVDFSDLSEDIYTLYIVLRDDVWNRVVLGIDLVNGQPEADEEFQVYVSTEANLDVRVEVEYIRGVVIETDYNIDIRVRK